MNIHELVRHFQIGVFEANSFMVKIYEPQNRNDASKKKLIASASLWHFRNCSNNDESGEYNDAHKYRKYDNLEIGDWYLLYDNSSDIEYKVVLHIALKNRLKNETAEHDINNIIKQGDLAQIKRKRGRPPVDKTALKAALTMYYSKEHSLKEIVNITKISQARLYTEINKIKQNSMGEMF